MKVVYRVQVVAADSDMFSPSAALTRCQGKMGQQVGEEVELGCCEGLEAMEAQQRLGQSQGEEPV